MTKRFLRISAENTLRETLGILLHGEQKKYDTGAIVIIDQEGEFAGIATPSQLAIGLVGKWESNDEPSKSAFTAHAETNLSETVDTILNPNQPIASPLDAHG